MKKLTITEKNGLEIKRKLEEKQEVIFNFKWSISKGRDTYGYNICTCKANNLKVGQCNGGGYDMQGVAIAMFFNMNYKEELKKSNIVNYGYDNNSNYINGMCGLSCVLSIIEKLGFTVKYNYKKNSCDYIISKVN